MELLLSCLHTRSSRAVSAQVQREVSIGAFAGATAFEARDTVALWRRILDAFLPAMNMAECSVVQNEALQRIEELVQRRIRQRERRRIDIIALGASAGGVPILSELMSHLPAELPVTLLIVQHLSRRVPSVLPELLARRSAIRIAPAVQGAPIYLGYAYVAPPNYHLMVAGGALALSDDPPVHFVKPSVDVLFSSAAREFGNRLASVVLSGSGEDGADGTRAVHQFGGFTVAQDPQTAPYASMPEAAIATGCVDLVVPEAQIAPLMRELALSGRPNGGKSAALGTQFAREASGRFGRSS